MMRTTEKAREARLHLRAKLVRIRKPHEIRNSRKRENYRDWWDYLIFRKLITSDGYLKIEEIKWSTCNDENMGIYILEYIMQYFSIWESQLLFATHQSFIVGWKEEDIKKAKRNAMEPIELAEEFGTLSPIEIKRYKKKVRDMSPLLFGLIVNVITKSCLFFEDENDYYFDYCNS